MVVRQPYAPAAFTPGEIPGTHFQGLSLPLGTWFCRKEQRKKFSVTPPGIDPGTVRLVAPCLNHYATPGSTDSIKLLKVFELQKRLYASPSISGPYRDVEGSREIIYVRAFTVWFEV